MRRRRKIRLTKLQMDDVGAAMHQRANAKQRVDLAMFEAWIHPWHGRACLARWLFEHVDDREDAEQERQEAEEDERRDHVGLAGSGGVEEDDPPDGDGVCGERDE